MKINNKCIKRALRTFLQALVGYLAVNLPLVDFSNSKNAIRSALVGVGASAVAAGMAAVMNIKGGNSNENG